MRPLGYCMLPVMTGALFAMLQGYPALAWLTVGFPLAAVCASIWTWHAIRSRVCEVVLYEDRVAALSEFEAAEPPTAAQWKWVIDLRVSPQHADLTLGLSSIRLNRADWSEWEELVSALHWALHLHKDGPTGA